MKTSPFSLAVDGSNDNNLKKMNPLIVRIFDSNRGKVKTSLLDMCMSRSGTAEVLFTKVDDVLTAAGLGWDNCVGMALDNASVNLGKSNSIRTRVLQKNPAVYFNGCPCHIVHNTSRAASSNFEDKTGFDVEDFLVDLYNCFDHSTKRKNALLEYTMFCDQEYRKILKHLSTRWLSLETAVSRALLQYPSLKSYCQKVTVLSDSSDWAPTSGIPWLRYTWQSSTRQSYKCSSVSTCTSRKNSPWCPLFMMECRSF